jgi:hypothetical protein
VDNFGQELVHNGLADLRSELLAESVEELLNLLLSLVCCNELLDESDNKFASSALNNVFNGRTTTRATGATGATTG